VVSSTKASTSSSVPVSYSNGTYTSATPTESGSKTSSYSVAGGSPTSSPPAVVTKNAAVAKVASAGLALGGILMAFAL